MEYNKKEKKAETGNNGTGREVEEVLLMYFRVNSGDGGSGGGGCMDRVMVVAIIWVR